MMSEQIIDHKWRSIQFATSSSDSVGKYFKDKLNPMRAFLGALNYMVRTTIGYSKWWLHCDAAAIIVVLFNPKRLSTTLNSGLLSLGAW